jgi:peptidoglycan hydrolase-like protein with peptidoglycan-binding domain
MSQQHDQQTIRQVQQALKQKGHDVEADGVMGPNTQAALRQYQQQQGMDATGQLDQRTLTSLGVQGGAGATGSS